MGLFAILFALGLLMWLPTEAGASCWFLPWPRFWLLRYRASRSSPIGRRPL
jgi:hypothetical protein